MTKKFCTRTDYFLRIKVHALPRYFTDTHRPAKEMSIHQGKGQTITHEVGTSLDGLYSFATAAAAAGGGYQKRFMK